MRASNRFFKAAGFVFTYPRGVGTTRRLDMWREDPTTGERYWVTMARCKAERPATYATALAMVAWVSALEVRPRTSTKAQAVAECLAVTADRMKQHGARVANADRRNTRLDRRTAAA